MYSVSVMRREMTRREEQRSDETRRKLATASRCDFRNCEAKRQPSPGFVNRSGSPASVLLPRPYRAADSKPALNFRHARRARATLRYARALRKRNTNLSAVKIHSRPVVVRVAMNDLSPRESLNSPDTRNRSCNI